MPIMLSVYSAYMTRLRLTTVLHHILQFHRGSRVSSYKARTYLDGEAGSGTVENPERRQDLPWAEMVTAISKL